MYNLKLIISILTAISFSLAQIPSPTPATVRFQGKSVRDSLKAFSLVKNLPFTSIGPTVMSGRVVDIEGDPKNPQHFFVAYASGGLWESKTNGITFKPLFDKQTVMSIGDIAVDWEHGQKLWVGTGENNSSRSSYSGTGVYSSVDSGKTWQFKGLAESQHIGRILVHPQNPDILWVAALGHLYSANSERGVFKSTDGGNHWQKVLYVDENTGAVDLALDAQNPDILYAAMWERSRRAWDFSESGSHSGIYKSTDGGNHWLLISSAGSGFPTGSGVGRIGLALSPTNPHIIYALLDNQFHRPKDEEFALTKDMLREMTADDFLKLKADDLNDYLDRYQFPKEFNADTLFQLVKQKTISPITLVEFLENANAQLFDTPVIGAELYRSEDSGVTWKRTHANFLDQMFYTFGYYFGNIRLAPDNPDKIYLLGVPLIFSEDGGKTFSSINTENVHVDHHALWLDPKHPKHLISGNDGGLNITFDGGQVWHKANSIPVGQFYSVAVDMAKPFNVYGGLQDNGVWVGPSKQRESRYWHASGHYPYKELLGGDGMQIAVDTRDNKTVYTGYQFGNYYRINTDSEKSKYITPRHHLGERPLRFNWQAPIHLSVHNQDILYLGSQKVHRSMNQGNDWQTISGDLTLGGRKGDVPFGTLTTIHESPLQFGLLYAGSDDGQVQVTRDGGHSWQNISAGLPQNFWISRVQASAHDTATVYVSLNGYRWDNFDALVFISRDFGAHWTQLGLDLPAEPVNVIKEDPQNPEILYVGTDHGLYLSIDKGKSFMAFNKDLTDAPVHDLVVHSRDHKLVVATHGRSLYTADVSLVQQLKPDLIKKKSFLFPVKKVKHGNRWGSRNYSWNFDKGPLRQFSFYSNQKQKYRLKLLSDKNKELWVKEDTADAGLNFSKYDLTVSEKSYRQLYKSIKKNLRPKKIKAADDGKYYLLPGKYTLQLEINNQKESQVFEIEAIKKDSRKKQKKTP